MGNQTSNGQNGSHHYNSDPINAKDVDLLRMTWKEVNQDDIGIITMIRIFQEHKEIKSKWIFATNLETEAEMLSNSQVRYHAKKIYGVISKILEKLIATTDVRQFDIDEFGLVKLGRSHYHYNVRREHFAHFEESLIYALKKCISDKVEFNAKAERAWRKVFWLIADSICDGIEIEMKEREGRTGSEGGGSVGSGSVAGSGTAAPRGSVVTPNGRGSLSGAHNSSISDPKEQLPIQNNN